MRRLLLVLVVLAGATLLARGAFPCAAISLQPTCYVALRPGPTANTFELVEVPERRTYSSAGQLVLTTVAVDVQLDLGAWLRGALTPGVDQVRRNRLFEAGDDRDDISQRNAALMVGSQADATIAALRELGFDPDTEFDGAEVFRIDEPTAVTDDQLQVGDVIVAVGGEPVDDNQAAVELLDAYAPGDTVTLTIERGEATRDVSLELIESPDAPGEALIGVSLVSYLELPVDVVIDADGIGGPSAGLMFSLSIVDVLGEEDLTGGRVVAGTGEIDRQGQIGAIGGVRQKVLGAVQRDDDERPASVFLVPEANMAEARTADVSGEILLVPVATLDDALTALADLRAGRDPTGAFALGAG